METAFLLIALGFGFRIFADAVKSTRKGVKALGIAIAIFMMVMALFGALCKTCYTIQNANCPLPFSKCPKTSMKGYASGYSGFHHPPIPMAAEAPSEGSGQSAAS